MNADTAPTLAKIADNADFTSDMTLWPDAMVHAYLESNGDEAVARRLLFEKLMQEACDA